MSSLFGSTRNTRVLKGGSIDGLRYIRSDCPEKLCEEEIQWLIDNNVLTVVDLRQEHEAAANPCPLCGRPEFTYLSIPVTTGNIVPLAQLKIVRNTSKCSTGLWPGL
jgi:protein-tyrosine phosphatase